MVSVNSINTGYVYKTETWKDKANRFLLRLSNLQGEEFARSMRNRMADKWGDDYCAISREISELVFDIEQEIYSTKGQMK